MTTSTKSVSTPVLDVAPPVGVGHGGHGVAGDGIGLVLTGPLNTTLAVAALVLGAATAGLAILGPLLPRSRRIELVVRTTTAMLLGVLAIGWLGHGMDLPPLLAPAAAAVTAAALTHRGHRRGASVAGVVLLGLLAAGIAGGELGWPAIARAGYLGGAALWLGSSLPLALVETGSISTGSTRAGSIEGGSTGAGARAVARRRLGWVAGASALVVVAALVVRTWSAGLRFDAVSAGSAVGLTTVGALTLLAGAAALAGLGYTATRRGSWLSASAIALGVTTGVVAGALTPPAEAAAPGRPLVRTVALGDDQVSISVVPQRPGTNLVHVSRPGVSVGGVPAVARSGASGGWAVVQLPPGTRGLAVEADGQRQRLRLDLGDVPAAFDADLGGPDGPECLSAIVAASLAGRLLDTCPADHLQARDEAAIRAGVDFLASRGVPRLHIIGDGSARATAAAALARRSAAARNLPVVDTLDIESAVLVVAGWEYGGRRLTEEALGLSTRFGTYTAPWLAVASILGRQTGAVTILDFDSREQPAQRYLAALRSAGVIDLATPAGFRAWDGAPSEGGLRVFSAAQVSVMPADVDGEEHHRSLDRWMPGGTLTPVTAALPE